MQSARFPTSFPIELLPCWSRWCERNRFIAQVIVTGPLAIACTQYLNFVVMLVVVIVGSWPVPYRARWIPEGLEVWWLFVRERLPVADVESVRLRTNARYCFFVRYARALELEFTDGRRAIIVAPDVLLGTLHGEFAAALERLAPGPATRAEHPATDSVSPASVQSN